MNTNLNGASNLTTDDKQPKAMKDRDEDVWTLRKNGEYEVVQFPGPGVLTLEQITKWYGPLTSLEDKPKQPKAMKDRDGHTWTLRKNGKYSSATHVQGNGSLTMKKIAKLFGPLTPLEDEPEQPTSATVTLPCPNPECEGTITRQVHVVNVGQAKEQKWNLEFVPVDGPVGERTHICKTSKLKEPTEFGAKATFTFSNNGYMLRLFRSNRQDFRPWQAENGVEYSWNILTEWDGERGSLTLGWPE